MSKPAALGIDIGGTKTLCVLVDRHCRIIEDVKFKTAPLDGRKKFTANLVASARMKRIEKSNGFAPN